MNVTRLSMIPGALLALMLVAPAAALLHHQVVDYHQGGATLSGYVAYDDSFPGLRPAVLVFHHWMGIDQYIKDRTDQLARMGYVAFAATSTVRASDQRTQLKLVPLPRPTATTGR